MYLARFSYDVLPANRERALSLIRREAEAARSAGLGARLLVPLTRGKDGAALQFEVELGSLDQLETLRHRGGDASGRSVSPDDAERWMHEFSEILLSPPCVEILRVDTAKP